MINTLYWIAALSLLLNILYAREARRKQRNERKLRKKHRRAVNALDARENQVANLIYEIKDLEKKVM